MVLRAWYGCRREPGEASCLVPLERSKGSLGKMKSKQRPRGHAGARPREETVGQMRGRGTHRWKGTHIEVQGRHGAALGKAECDRDGGEEEPGCGLAPGESLISEETIQFIIQA